MFEAFLHQIQSELGPLHANWFEELSASADGRPRDDEGRRASPRDHAAVFRAPDRETPGLDGQLSSTPKIFRNAGAATRDSIARGSPEPALLDTPKSSLAQDASLKRISESLGAQLNPDLSWSSSFNTPSALSPTVILPKRKEQSSPGSFLRDQEVIFVRQLFPSLSTAAEATSDATLDKIQQPSQRKGVDTSSDSTQGFWRQTVPEAIKDGEVRDALEEVLDGAEDVLAIFFSNSNSALRRVKSNERAKKGVSGAPKEVTSALTAKSDADSTSTSSLPAADVRSPVKNDDFTQWTPLSLSEVPDSKAGQICSSDLADEGASFTCKNQVELLQPSRACSGIADDEKCRLDAHAERFQGKSSLFETPPARKNRKFVYRVQTPCPSKRKDQNATPGGFKPATAAASTTSEETSFIESKHEDSLAREAAVQPPNPEALRLDHGLDMTQLCKAFAEDFTQDVKLQTSPKKSDHGGLIVSTCCGQAAKIAPSKTESENAREDVVEFHLDSKEPMGCEKTLDVNTPEMMETEESVKFADDGAVISCDSKLYSGFKTARNKVIVVPPEAVMKAKSALDESVEQCASGQSALSATEATKASHKTVLPTESRRYKRSESKPAATTPTGTSKEVAKAIPDSFMSQTNKSSFQTASARSITVSSVHVEDLAGEKTLLNPLHLEVGFAEDPKFNSLSREEPANSSLTASQKADVTELCSILEEGDSQYEFTQFKPTKPAWKSPDSAELAREWDPDMLAGIDFDDSFNGADSGRHVSRNPEARPDVVRKDSPNRFAQPNHISCVPQETATAKDSSTQDDLALRSEASAKEEPTSFFGFKTATGNAVNISEKCLKAAKSLFADLEDGEGNLDLKCDSRRTGSLKRGREVASTSSSKASARHIKRMDDGKARGIGATETSFAPELEGNPCNGNASLVAKESGIFEPFGGASDLDVGREREDQRENLSSGFCTARGKKVANLEGVSCKSEDLTSPSAPFKPNAPDRLVKADPKLLESLTAYKHNTEIAERKESRCPRPTAVESSGFKMASGRKVSISASAVLRSKSIFKDLDDTPDIPNQTAQTSPDLGAAGEACTFLSGLEMMSGKRVSFSQKAFTKSEAFLQDCDPDACAKLKVTDDCKAAAESAAHLAQTDSLNKEVWSLNEEATALDEHVQKESTKTSATIFNTSGGGFTTASGKTVSVSRDALQRAKAVLDEANVSPRKVPGREWSLSTAGGKSVAASDEALQKAKGLFMGCDLEGLAPEENLFSSVKTSASLGFSTASGKGVVVSEKALKEAKRLFAGCEESAVDGEEVESPFDDQIVPYKPKYSRSISAIGRSAGNQKDDLPKVGNLGFSTASGKGVVVSEKALKEAKSVFAGCEENYVDGADVKVRFAVPKMLKISKCPSSKCDVGRLDGRSELKESGNPKADLSKAGNLGFSTASGKDVVVSEKALRETKSVFAGCDESSVDEEERQSRFDVQKIPKKPKYPSDVGRSDLMKSGNQTVDLLKEGNLGFSTASGKDLLVSEKALEEAKSLFSGCDEGSVDRKEVRSCLEVQEMPPKSKIPSRLDRRSQLRESSKAGNSGFSTASGKGVVVSEKALKEAKRLLAGCDESSVDEEKLRSRSDVQKMPKKPNYPGDIGRSAERSEFTECGNQKADLSNAWIVGFSTAGGKGVSVSTSARGVALETFQDCDPRPLTVTENENTETSGSRSTKIREKSDPTNPVETSAQSPPSRLSQEESLLLLNLNGCTVTQQEYFEREAVACAKALLEDDLNEQSLTGSLEDVSVGESSEAKGDGGRRKRVNDESDSAGLPPLKRRLVSEFDQISANARCAAVKSSPNATSKDRRVFKYNLKPNVTHPPRNVVDQRPTLANPCQLASPHRAVPKGQTSSRKTAAFVPPFHKSGKAETAKEASGFFAPPFAEKSGVTAGEQEERAGFKEETSLQEEKPQVGYEEEKSATEERRKEGLEERNAGAGNDQDERWTQALALARDLQEMRIRKKKRQTIRPLPGSLYLTKTAGVTRVSLREAVGCQRPVRHTEKELYQRGVHAKVSEIGSENAESFRFKWEDFFRREVSMETAGVQLADGGWLVPDNRGTVGKEEFYRALCDTPGVDPKLMSDTWAYNHYRWIVWKRAAMERAFPEMMGSRCLTPQQVLLQLKLRYDIEVDHSRRSALKKITERDDTPAKTLVLCVCGVDFSGRGGRNWETLDSKSEQPAAVVWLTDGWYCMKGLLDAPLCAMLRKGRLRAGTKIITHGAELIGSQDACPPLEAPDSLMLKISANSTRRVRWDTKLGFYKDPRPFQLPLSSLYPSGGAVGCVDVIVLRCYPIQWMEKRSGGVFVFRTERAEERAARHHNSTKQKTVELLVSKIQAQFEKEEEEQKKRRRSRRLSRRELEKLQDGEEIYEAMESDPAYVEAHLTPRQVELVSSYRRAETERRRAELQERVRKAVQEAEQVEGGCTVRNVTPVWKLAIADAQKRHIDCVYTLNIWRPSVELQSLLREGSRFGVYHLATSETRKRSGNANVQFTATKKTQFQRVEVSPEWSKMHFPARQLTSFRDLQNPNFSSPCGEVDIVGYVISILNRRGPAPLLYLADEKCDVVSVKICSSLTQLALDELLKPFALLAASNLQLCQLSAPVPALYAGQQAVFSANPKEAHLHLATERLKAFAQACETFFRDAEEKISSLVPPDTLPSPRTPGLTSKTRPNGRKNVTPQKQSRVFSPFAPVTKRTPGPPTNAFAPSAPSEPKDSRSVKRKRGADFLSRIPSPPPLPPLAPLPSPSVNKTFNPPRRCQAPRPPQPPPARSRAATRLQHEHEEEEEEEEEEGEWVNDEELAMINTQALLQGKRTCS